MKDHLSIEGLTPKQISELQSIIENFKIQNGTTDLAEFLKMQEEHEKGEICNVCGEKNCGTELNIESFVKGYYSIYEKPIDAWEHCGECGCKNCNGTESIECDEARSWIRFKKEEKKERKGKK
jgi:hypothetical protein